MCFTISFKLSQLLKGSLKEESIERLDIEILGIHWDRSAEDMQDEDVKDANVNYVYLDIDMDMLVCSTA